jgi:predicted amidohydrolase YtcJ
MHRPDLIIVAERIHLLGQAPPARALLIRDGRVLAAGDEDEARQAALPGAILEQLPGATITPGFTDAHVHLTTWALNRRWVDLNAARTLEDGLAAIASAGGDGWVRGIGWDVHRWGRLPSRADLDAVCPGRPAFLQSHDIHAAWLNSEALRRSGITRETADPEGGSIVRDASGEPTGILLERAVRLAEVHLPEPSADEVREALVEAQAALHRYGITGVHSVEVNGLEDFTRLDAAGLLRLRVLQAIQLPRLDAAIQLGLRSGFGGDWIRIGGVKMFLDGALGSRTAWLREPYLESFDDRGIRTLEPEEFRDHVSRAAFAGLSSTVHAIGDAAVELAIEVLSGVPRVAAMPHRIEHVQLCPPDLWAIAGRSGLIGSVQPIHLMTDIPAAERHWGHERSRGAYPFAALQRAGMTLAFGSDIPVESCDPRLGLHAATARLGWDGTPAGGWFPEHAVSAEAAVRAYTEGPALASGESGRRGRLVPGYDADLVAWDVDPLTAAPDRLREMHCLLTMVGGEIVHRA